MDWWGGVPQRKKAGMAIDILRDGPHGPVRPAWAAECGDEWPCVHFREWILAQVAGPTIQRLIMQQFWHDFEQDLGLAATKEARDAGWMRMFDWLPRPVVPKAPALPQRQTAPREGTVGPTPGYQRIHIGRRSF
jgi:hypothetical protein